MLRCLLPVFKVQCITKEFVARVIHVKMQCHLSYIIHHATRVAKAVVAYRTKDGIVDNDMV